MTKFMKTIVRILRHKFAIKTGIAGGAVYYLAEQGIWKESAESTKIYNRIDKVIEPYVSDVKKQLPIEIPALPKSEKVSYLLKQYWNDAVMSSFRYLSKLPEHASKLTQSGFNAAVQNEEMKKFIDSFSSTEKK